MNNYEKWCKAIRLYANDFAIEVPGNFQCTMKDASLDDANNFYVYDLDDNLLVINLDVFVKDIYYKIYGNKVKGNTPNSADAFLVNGDNHWFLIEFKNSCIFSKKENRKNQSNNQILKDNIIKKAYSSGVALIDVLYNLKNKDIYELNFDYESPIDFFRNNVVYILVCSKDKNSEIQKSILNSYKTNKTYCYTPPFMNKLKGYIFKDALAYTDDYFMREFIRRFSYE